MGSEDRVVRENQKAKAVVAFEARKAALASAGLDEKAIGRDPLLRSLKAKLKEARGRIAAMEAREAHVKETAEKDTKVKKETKSKGEKGKGGGAKADKPKGDKDKAAAAPAKKKK